MVYLFVRNNAVALCLIMSLVAAAAAASPTDEISSCLTARSVNNFTTSPTTENESRAYYTLLNYSIQNLRFANPNVPKPTAIVIPESVGQLVNTVICCRESSLEIRVRSGGHSYEGTSFIASDGTPFVIVDMMNLNNVSVDLETKTAWVEGGATLGETYYAIAEATGGSHGFPAGTCPTVGVGGHIGGGGYGFLSRKYGLAADNVVDALLVDANGRILDRKGMGEDVFWAIRGGGGGVWGIVYGWKIKLLAVPQVVTAFTVSRQPVAKRHIASLVNKWQKVAPHLPDNFYLSCFVGASLPEAKQVGKLSATFNGFFLGPKNQVLQLLHSVFPQLAISEEECQEMSWIQSIAFFGGVNSVSDLNNRYSQDKKYFKAKSDYVTSPISLGGISGALDMLDSEPKGYVILDPYGGIMNKTSSDSIAFPHRQGNLFTIQYLVEWHEEDNNRSEEYVDWIRVFYNTTMPPYVSNSPRSAYVNYMDFDLGVLSKIPFGTDEVDFARSWGEKYFLKNYDKLVRVKSMIDPNNVFRNQQGIPITSSISLKADT